MLQKRFGASDETEATGASTSKAASVAMAEATRSSAEYPKAGKPREHQDDEKISIFWRVFGGTILSMVALGAITLYNSISTSIAELRSELNREREARAELVKKDEFNTRASSHSERIRALDGLRAEFEGMKERTNASAAGLDGLKKELGTTADTVKKDAATLEGLKERLVALEALKKDLAGLEVVKEKLATAASDLKATREDVMKVQQEQERNRLSDLERKVGRDSQFKQLDDSLKELQKGLQTCREKLARLEGSQPTGPVRGTTPGSEPAPPNKTDKPAGKPNFADESEDD